jgi:outer membrane immunogenic protein
MLRITTSVAALVAATSFAMAADLPIEPAPMEPAFVAPAPIFSWTGAYIGVSGGYAWGEFDGGDSDFFAPGTFGTSFDTSVDADGWLIGGTIGYNQQFNQFVLGIEADLSYVDIEEVAATVFTEPGVGSIGIGSGAELDYLGTVRARAGFAIDRFMPYVTGGLAVGRVEAAAAIDFDVPGVLVGTFADSDKNTHIGWTVGAGVEGAITDNLTAKIEYLYVDLGEETYNFDLGVGGVDADIDFTAHIVRAGLNYKFSF